MVMNVLPLFGIFVVFFIHHMYCFGYSVFCVGLINRYIGINSRVYW